MSQTEHHIGKLTEVSKQENETTEQLMLRILLENNKETELPSWYEDTKEWFNGELSEIYYYHNNKVYKIEDREFEDDSDIIEANLKPDNTIEYQIKFYNGGASFNECLEEALINLYNTKHKDR